MNMNPNNMNFQMGMQNQMMDDISPRIKIIVEPYEKKIKELEEQLRNKEFEIVVLKEKLFRIENNKFSNNFPGFNNIDNPFNMGNMGMPMQMGVPMGQNMGMNMHQDNDLINLIFSFGNIMKEEESQKIILKCLIDEQFESIKNRVIKKLNLIGDYKFIYNSKKTNPKLTASELGMINNAMIFIIGGEISKEKKNIQNQEENITDKITIIFNSTQGVTHSVNCDKNISIGLAIKKYLNKIGMDNDLIESNESKLQFLYNASKYTTKDKISLQSLFRNINRPKIVVNDIHNIIGA